MAMNKTKRKPSSAELKSKKLVPRRRNTCPSPQDISRALQSPSPAPSISAASLDELIQRCLNSFDSEGRISSPRGSQLVQMVLMMHMWVVPSQTFAQKLLTLYKDCPSDKRGLRRSQICHLVRRWISQFPAVFETDPLLEQTMGDLWALVCSDGQEAHSQFIDPSGPNPHENISQAPSPSVKKRKVSLIFDHMEPDEMAEHLSYLEFRNFCNVSFLDYRSYVVRGSVRDNPALERTVMMCNGVSQWVQLMILSRHTAQQRAQVFTKFIHVAQKLRALQNFNTLMAVTGGLCHSSISRLKDTYNLLPPDVTKVLNEMTELLSSRSNYSNYRRVYNECSGFKVPILGVHLKDLISLNEALPDFIDNDKINLSKLQHLYSNINDLLLIHSCTPPFEANKDLLHLLTLSLDLYYTEDEIYELSYTKEPKNPKIQPVAPVKPPVVAEWGSGVTPRLDPDTISKHVKQMVDSIMKNYDQNQDGYISLEDFEKIAANFPFSFRTHETDRLGEISRDEITSYFMRGMSVCAKLGYNFNETHNFHETTYKRPTFCDHCGGFLWGVIKQGFHCKDCGINCHKHCRDVVGSECLKKDKNTSSCPCTPGPDSKTKSNSWSMCLCAMWASCIISHIIVLNCIVCQQIQRRTPLYSPKAMMSAKITIKTLGYWTALLRQTREFGHRTKRRRGHTIHIHLYMVLQIERSTLCHKGIAVGLNQSVSCKRRWKNCILIKTKAESQTKPSLWEEHSDMGLIILLFGVPCFSNKFVLILVVVYSRGLKKKLFMNFSVLLLVLPSSAYGFAVEFITLQLSVHINRGNQQIKRMIVKCE